MTNPTDDLSLNLNVARRQRLEKDPRFLKALEEDKQFVAEQEKAAATAKAAPAPATPAPAPKVDQGPGFFAEAAKALAGGARDAAQEVVDLVDEAATWLDNNLINLRYGSKDFGSTSAPPAKPALEGLLPEVPKNESTAGSVTRSITQFLVPFMGAMKALKWAGAAGKTVAGKAGAAMAAGAATDFSAFDPHEKRLSNLINDFAKTNPTLANPITEYLAADPRDTAIEGRFKNALEGAGLGVAVEGVFAAFRAFRSYQKASGKSQAPAARVEPEMPAEPSKDLGTLIEEYKAPRTPVEEIDDAADIAVRRANEGAAPAPGRAPRTPDPDVNGGGVFEEADAAARAPRTPSEIDSLPKTDDGTPRLDIDGTDVDVPREPRAPRTPDPEGEAVAINSALDKVLKDVETGAARRAYIDPDDGVIYLSRERPEGAALDLDQKVAAALEKTGAERTAEDLIALRAYKQAQEAAFKGLIELPQTAGRVFSDADRAALRSPIMGATERPATRAFTDAERQAIREQGEEIAAQIAENARRIAEITDKANRVNQPLTRGRYMRMQGGYVSPTVLINMASSGAGAALGAATADDDASFAERLDRAGIGALAGLGVKVGASKLTRTAGEVTAERAAKKAAERDVVAGLARKEHEGIAPRPAQVAQAAPGVEPKRVPPIRAAKVNEMVEDLRAGRAPELAAKIEDAGINFRNLDSDADINELLTAFAAKFEPEIAKATRGVVSLEETAAFAREIGTSPESLKSLYKDLGFTAERVTAHRALLMASAETTQAQVRHVLANPQDLDAVLALRKQVAVHAALQAQMKGVQTEIGRALSAFRIQATAVDFKADEVSALIDSLGGYKANIDFAKKLSQITDPVKFNAITRKSALARTGDALFEAWVNGLLSGIRTMVVNVLGNAVVPVMNAGEKALAAGFGAIRGAAKADRVRLGEVTETLRGNFEGMMDALKITSEGFGEIGKAAELYARGVKLGDSRLILEAEQMISGSSDIGNAVKSLFNKQAYTDSLHSSQVEQLGMRNAITSDAFNLRPDTIAGAVTDYLGSLVRTPGRVLMAQDETFKTMLYRGELRSLAFRKASNEGLEGDALVQRMNALLDQPTPEMSVEALMAARRGTFSDPLGPAMQAIQNAVQKVPGARYIMPFIRTPTNILNYVGERTPLLNAYSKRVREDLAAGGAKRDLVLAQSSMGAFLYWAAYELKVKGLITGGGDKNQQAERLGAKQQYSIRLGDKWYAFNRLDPVGMFFGLAADFADIVGQTDTREAEELAGAAFLALNRNLLSKSYLKGLTDALQVANDPDRFGASFINRFAGSWVPSIVASGAQAGDPYVKEVWTAFDAVKARLPGFSSSVPNHVNLLGEDVKFTDAWGPDFASPIRQMSTEGVSPLALEIGEKNVDLRHPRRSQEFVQDAPPIDLTPQQYHRLMKITGSLFKQHGEKLVASAGYQALPDAPESAANYTDGKQFALKQTWYASLKAGRAKLMQEDRELRRKVETLFENKARVMQGLPPLPVN